MEVLFWLGLIMTILLIEDDKRLAEFISLSLPGINTLIAKSLAEAKNILSISRPHLLLIDLNLPDSSGLDTLYALKSFNGPKIALTGHPRDESISFSTLGIIDYIQKTESLDCVISRIKFNISKIKPKCRFEPGVFKEIQACLLAAKSF